MLHSSFSAATSVWAYILYSSYTTRCEYLYQPASDGILQVRVNNTSGAGTYQWAVRREIGDASGENTASNSDTEIQFSGGSNDNGGDWQRLEFTMKRWGSGTEDDMLFNWVEAGTLSDGNVMEKHGAGRFNASETGGLISLRFDQSGGTMSGYLRCWATISGLGGH